MSPGPHPIEPTGLPVRAPQRTLETQEFWDACAQGRLVAPQCNACDALVWYPRRTCPVCGAQDVRWVELSGFGTVYSRSIIRKGQGAYTPVGPYVLAYVELDEGPRVLTNVVGCPVDDVQIGMAVEVVFDPVGEVDALPRFRPRSTP